MAHNPEALSLSLAEILRWQRLKKAFIALLILTALTINILAPILAWQWAQLPFLGLLTEQTLVVANVYNPGWSARQAGLTGQELLLAVNETPVANGQDLRRVSEQLVVGDQATLTLRSLDSAPDSTTPNHQLTIDVAAFPGSDFLAFFAVPYLVGLLFLAIGLFVYRLRASARSDEVFVVFCVSFSIFTGAFFDLYTNHHLTAVWTVVLPFVGASLIHLALVFPLEPRFIKRRPKLRFAPYLPAAILGLYGLFGLYQADPTAYFGPWRLEFAFSGLSILIFFGLMVRTMYLNFSPLVRQQTRLILSGGLLAFIPALIWAVAAGWFGMQVDFVPLVTTIIFGATLLFPLSIAYAILRYRLLQLDLTAREVGVSVSLVAVVIAVYVALSISLQLFFDVASPASNPIFLLVYGLVVLVFLEPLRNWLRRLIDKLALIPTKDYREALQKYAGRLATLPLEVNGILVLYLEQVQAAVQTDRLFIFFINSRGTTYDIRAKADLELPKSVYISYKSSDKLPQWLSAKREALRFDAAGRPVQRVPIDQEQIARLAMLNIRIVVPLAGTDKLLGWLALGDRRDGKPYDRRDMAFLSNISKQTVIALENAQLFEMANRKTRELLALQETSLDIASEQETARILTSVLERAASLLNAMGGSIYLLDPVHGLLNNEVCYKLDSDYASISLKVGQGIAGRVAHSGQPKIIRSYMRVPDQVEIHKGVGFGSVVAVPFAWKGEVKGVLELIRTQDAPQFIQDDVELLSILANQAAIALENARLLQEAKDKAAQLETLTEVNRMISATLDRDVALKLITDTAVAMLQTEAGSIFLTDERSQSLTFEIAHGPSGTQLIGATIPIDTHSIAGSIALSREAMIVNDVASDPRWNTSFDEASNFHTRDILGVPMIAFGKVVGVIELLNKTNGRGFNQNDLATLDIFAQQAAVAIINAERFTQTDQALASRMQELNTLHMIDRELNASLDLEMVLDLTLSRTLDAFGSSVGLIGLVDEERTGLHFEAMIGIANEYERYRTEVWPFGRGVIGQVAETGSPLYTANGELDNFAGDGRSISQLCVPMQRDEEVIGIISMELADADPFTEKDQEFATRLASHAALAIQNARLFAQVKAANQAKTEFMSVASHELKIPMTSIKGYARLLEMTAGDILSAQQKEFLKIISANIDRMNRLVSDLLDVSRIEAGRLKLELAEVSIKEVVDEVVQSVETQIRKKELDLVIEIPATIPKVWADYGRLVQVMTNLISNAYKYTPGGGRVAVGAEACRSANDSQYISIYVSDTGLGIAKEEQQQLFNKFFRAADPAVREEPGTGLGLAITKSLIEMHGGTMWFESELGQGSTFGFDLPITTPAAVKEGQTSSQTS